MGIQALILNSLLLASAVFSFSRYLWMSPAIAACVGVLLARKDKFLILYTCIAIAVAILSFDYIQDLVMLRFSDALTGSSDIERTAQTPVLVKLFLDAPLMGHGMGSYSHQVIRNDDSPYSYEDQLLALAGQVGLIGLLSLTGVLRYFRGQLILSPQRSPISIGYHCPDCCICGRWHV